MNASINVAYVMSFVSYNRPHYATNYDNIHAKYYI